MKRATPACGADRRSGLSLLLAALIGIWGARAAFGLVPPRGSDAPPIVLTDLGGTEVRTAALAGKTLVLIFGELGHEGAKRTCADVLDVLGDPRVSGDAAAPILIVAQDRPLAELKDEAARGRFPALVLHDPKREAFGAYRILVVPSIVVVDGRGKVVHGMPGFLPRFRDLLVEALQVAAGRETPDAFERSIAGPEGEPGDRADVRATRLAHLGDELARHGLDDLARARYGEAIALAPGHARARLGLARLWLRQGKLDEAEAGFRELIEADGELTDARLGLGEVCARRGGERLSDAESEARAVLARDAKNARAHYLLGLVYEARGEPGPAAASYRKAAELLLSP